MEKSLRSFCLLLFTSLFVAACGGGGDSNSSGASNGIPSIEGAPGATGNTAVDGFNWINFRRSAAGLRPLAYSSAIAKAAQNHSDYQRINGPFTDGGVPSPITHSETSGKTGFTGSDACPERILAAGYTLDASQGYACGEVISAMSSSSGVVAAEELIAAIYHRFIILQPSFSDGGAGSGPSYNGRYTIFTQNFAVRGSFSALGNGNVVTYPYNGQTQVPVRFDHSTEMPDPLPPSQFPQYVNVAVGYPVSVHADLDQRIDVSSFTLRRQSDGATMNARLLSAATDSETQSFSAAIVPFGQLSPATVYSVEFAGTICSKDWATDQCASEPVPLTRSWTFTTQ